MLSSDLSSDGCSSDLVQTTARLDHLAGLAQDLPLALDLLAAVAIVRGKPHRVDEIGEGREGEPRREDETDPKLRHMLRFWLCTGHVASPAGDWAWRSEEHTSELQSLMRISYAVFCLKQTKIQRTTLHSKDWTTITYQSTSS